MPKDPQCRKWLLTINNPTDYSHTQIAEIIRDNFRSIVYYCMADEIGLEEQTPHTHLYMMFSGGVRFSTVKRYFPTAHIEAGRASSLEIRDYIDKSGKWENDEKHGTKVDGTFEEWGEIPEEYQGVRFEEMAIIERIQDGATNAEILREFPHYLRGLRDVEYVRQTLRAEEYREKWRDLEVTYIWGPTGTGKTRSVMDGCGYANVYAVNNYKHPFDGYAGENILLLDEFASQFRIQDMNNYLDGYPLTLPARYSNKQACYERIFIISNLDLREQYQYERLNQSEVFDAFIRRIHRVIRFFADGSRLEYQTGDYMSGVGIWTGLTGDSTTPWDDKPPVVQELPECEQLPMPDSEAENEK